MTYKRYKIGFWLWRKHRYILLDDAVDYFEITSPKELKPKQLDIIFDKAIKLQAPKGEFKTEVGKIYYKLNNKIWTYES